MPIPPEPSGDPMVTRPSRRRPAGCPTRTSPAGTPVRRDWRCAERATDHPSDSHRPAQPVDLPEPRVELVPTREGLAQAGFEPTSAKAEAGTPGALRLHGR